MNDFQYAAPSSLGEATKLLAEFGSRARVLAGGTDILVQLREGRRSAEMVVDVKRVPELMSLSLNGVGLHLGASVPCYRLYDDEAVKSAYSALTDAARIIGGWQIQSRASVGGNLCNSSPAADSIPALMVLGATCEIASAGGTREVPAAEFCTGPGRNVLQDGELLVTIKLPPTPPHSGSAYLRFIPRNEMDIAVVGAGAWVQLNAAGDTIEQARVALSAVAPTPRMAQQANDWLAGQPATDATLEQAGELARAVAEPINDMRGTIEYRRHLAGVLTKRALRIAIDRAKTQGV
ncbi:MAG: xanthine dehydrogenase family protein subunit M [Planctomycetales bacterium]|nr:xanthine dehydrogenase family protein subunit M [Planctomycetales bacterium]MCA9220208.1 xanthine dehydrogenase family protein subunit M [Planctomycetales bacterium]